MESKASDKISKEVNSLVARAKFWGVLLNPPSNILETVVSYVKWSKFFKNAFPEWQMLYKGPKLTFFGGAHINSLKISNLPIVTSYTLISF